MKIVMIASECVPFFKTGGLADIVGTLPRMLKVLGHEVIVVLPKYAAVDGSRHGIKPFLGPMGVWMGNTEEWCSVHATGESGRSANSDQVPVYFIESQKYFDRPGLYRIAAGRGQGPVEGPL